MERAVLVYTNWPSVVEAEGAGRQIVERRLAIERAEEVVMMVTRCMSLSEAVGAAVKEMHAYETPAIMVLPVERLDPDCHAWIIGEAKG